MEIFGETIDRELADLAQEGVRTRFVGRRDRAPDWLQAKMAELEQATDDRDGGSASGSRSTTAAAPRSSRRRGGSSRAASSRTTSTRSSFARHLYAPEMPDPDLVIRTSGELRVSNFLLWQSAYAEFVFTDTLWPDFGPDEFRARWRTTRSRRRRFGGTMSNLISRVLVGARRPARSCSAWSGSAAGGCSGSSLVAGARRGARVRDDGAAAAAARAGALRRRRARARRRAQTGGLVWMLGGLLATFVLAFVLNAFAKTRAPATVAIGATVLGAAWIGFGLGHLLLLRELHDRRRGCSRSPCCSPCGRPTRSRTSADGSFGRHKLAPTLSPGKTWEGFVVGSARRRLRRRSSRSTTRAHTYLDDLAGGRARHRRRARGRGRRPVRVDAEARHAGEGHRAAARRPRRRPRPGRRAALRRGRPRTTSCSPSATLRPTVRTLAA